jgi:hypothetical protein
LSDTSSPEETEAVGPFAAVDSDGVCSVLILFASGSLIPQKRFNLDRDLEGTQIKSPCAEKNHPSKIDSAQLSFGMSSPPVRVLVLGSANGRIQELFEKLVALNAKAGPFNVVLCLGDLFGGADEQDDYFRGLISGEVEIPVSTYFTIGRKPLPESIRMLVGHGGQVCENLFFLGITFLGGR